MTRTSLLNKTIENLSKLPDDKLKEVSDFAEFLFTKIEDQFLTDGIQKLNSNSSTFDFLQEDEITYTKKDLREIYPHGKG